MPRLIPALIASAALSLLLSACGTPQAPAVQVPEVAEQVEDGAPPPAGLPEYAYRSSQAVKGYQIAIAEKKLLSVLPCYCGCGQDEEQYQNLKDCFFDSEESFRDHGANCQICLEEAIEAARWKAEGLTTGEIRARIDATYEGRGKPTNTPPVG